MCLWTNQRCWGGGLHGVRRWEVLLDRRIGLQTVRARRVLVCRGQQLQQVWPWGVLFWQFIIKLLTMPQRGVVWGHHGDWVHTVCDGEVFRGVGGCKRSDMPDMPQWNLLEPVWCFLQPGLRVVPSGDILTCWGELLYIVLTKHIQFRLRWLMPWMPIVL